MITFMRQRMSREGQWVFPMTMRRLRVDKVHPELFGAKTGNAPFEAGSRGPAGENAMPGHPNLNMRRSKFSSN
jgi:hypothetical protein